MPRTAEEILAHADELAKQFEAVEPDPGQIRDATTLRELARAFERLARAEADLASAVATARADGHTWSAIGAMLGTSGEAARQRYGGAATAKRRGSGGKGRTPATPAKPAAARRRRSEIRQVVVRRDDAESQERQAGGRRA
jgi:hypothetical protein